MSAEYHNTILADSLPVYSSFWGIFSSCWDSSDWTYWHSLMITQYGVAVANSKFLTAWNNSPTLAANLSWRDDSVAENTDFCNYAKMYNFYQGLFSPEVWAVRTALQAVPNAITAVGNVANNVSSAMTSISDAAANASAAVASISDAAANASAAVDSATKEVVDWGKYVLYVLIAAVIVAVYFYGKKKKYF